MALFNAYKVAAVKGQINVTSDTIKVMLLTSSYTPNVTNQTYYTDISANEASGTGYTAGGVVLSGISVTQDNTNNRAVVTATNPSWSGATISNFRYVVLFKWTGTGSTSQLIGYYDLGSTQQVTADTLTINLDATNGAFNLT